MPGQDNIITFGGTSARRLAAVHDPRVRRIADVCRGLLAKTLPQLMVGLFEQLDDSLYELADKSDNNALQTTYFDAMRELRKERLHIDRSFNQHVLRVYDQFWETGQVELETHSLDELSRDTDLALLDNDELEDSLAITNMISKSENRYSRELYALGQRFAYLVTGGHPPSQGLPKSPLEPAVICNAFQAAMKDVALELQVRLVVYKLFERHVVHYLGGLYDEINLRLGKSGIIPKLTPKVRRNPVAPAVRRAEAGSSQPLGDSSLMQESHTLTSGSGGGEVSQEEVFASLQQLLSLRRAQAGDTMLASSMITSGSSSTAASVPAVDTGELLNALSLLQQSNIVLLPQGGNQLVEPRDLRARLLEDLHLRERGEVSRALGEADNDTIDVIAMLFEFILEDFSLPDAMKALLSRLQIPMLKVAIIDKSFFSKKIHPARRLLNTLAQAAIGWNDTGDRETDSLYNKIESVVKRVLNEFQDDPGLFAELDEEFSAWWEQEQRGADVAEQRTNQVTRGKEQLRNAKQIVVQEINSRLKRLKVVPEAVMELLEDGWKDVLLLNYLRQGGDSEEWNASLEIVDRLLWSVEPKSSYAERQELLRSIPELLRNLRERLNGISFDQHKMARLFKELQNCHIGCLRGSGSGMAKGPGTAPAQVRQISFPDSQLMVGGSSYLTGDPEPPDEVIEDEFTQQAQTLEVGSWLEIQDGNHRSRVKLSWKSNVTDAYIFVNRKGMKALELSLQGLARHLRDGSAQLIEVSDEPIIDRALEAMLEALRNTGQAPSRA